MIGCNETSNLLSNMDNKDAKYILKAAKLTGFNIYIEAEARDSVGNRLGDCIAVHTREHGRDHGPFWDCFDKLKGRK